MQENFRQVPHSNDDEGSRRNASSKVGGRVSDHLFVTPFDLFKSKQERNNIESDPEITRKDVLS